MLSDVLPTGEWYFLFVLGVLYALQAVNHSVVAFVQFFGGFVKALGTRHELLTLFRALFAHSVNIAFNCVHHNREELFW